MKGMRIMKKMKRMLGILMAVIMSCLLSACSMDKTTTLPAAQEPEHLVLVIGCHSGSPGIAPNTLLNAIRPLCSLEGSTIDVIALDGNPYSVRDSAFKMLGLDKYTEAQKKRFAKSNAQSVVDFALENAVPKTAESSPLKALQLAARTVNAYGDDGIRKRILFADSFLSTVAPLDMSTTGLDIDVEKTVSSLAAQSEIPDLSGATVSGCYIGDTTPGQPELTAKDKEVLKELWSAILQKAGAQREDCTDVPAAEAHMVGDLPAVKTVPVGKTENAISLTEKEVITFTETDLGFRPDSTELQDETRARASLAALAAEIRDNDLSVVIAGSTATVPSAGAEHCKSFSAQRAERVARLLEDQGVKRSQMNTVGLGYSNHSRRVDDTDGSESAMQKNRVVYIATADSDFGKEVI